MKLINVVYDYEYDNVKEVIIVADDVDIISIPNYLCGQLDFIAQE